MKTRKLVLGLFVGVMAVSSVSAFAQQQGPDQFFRPVKSRDLITELPPRQDQDKTFSVNNSNFFDFDGRSNGCPETINIGSIDSDTDIFGNPRIDVVIENDIIIDCGGL